MLTSTAAVSETTPTPTGMTPGTGHGDRYQFKAGDFEGPLDLLLHLVRVNEVEITDIPVAAISAQYLSYLEVMRELNLDVVGDYLVMAATLAWIKSRMLLPPETSADDGEEIDPRAELVARLLEYQRFKEASEKLGDRQILGRDVYDVYMPHVGEVPEGEREIEVGLFELVRAFKTVFEAAKAAPKAHEIEAEQVTVHERMIAVMDPSSVWTRSNSSRSSSVQTIARRAAQCWSRPFSRFSNSRVSPCCGSSRA